MQHLGRRNYPVLYKISVLSEHFVFRKTFSMLFKWGYTFNHLSDYSQWNFSSWQKRKKLLKGL